MSITVYQYCLFVLATASNGACNAHDIREKIFNVFGVEKDEGGINSILTENIRSKERLHGSDKAKSGNHYGKWFRAVADKIHELDCDDNSSLESRCAFIRQAKYDYADRAQENAMPPNVIRELFSRCISKDPDFSDEQKKTELKDALRIAESPEDYISYISREAFSRFNVCSRISRNKNWLQYGKRELPQGTNIHYELIVGDANGESTKQIYAEWHAENGVKKAVAERMGILIDERIKKVLRKAGFALRCDEGVSVVDGAGGWRPFEDVRDELAKQMNYLYDKLNPEISKMIDNDPQEERLNTLVDLLMNSKQLILTGAPGTGKTHLAHEIAKVIVGNDGIAAGRCAKVQFHPGYDYSDFITGLKPELNAVELPGGVKSKQVTFSWANGVFKRMADDAMAEQEHPTGENGNPKPYVMIIDEINRADLSRVFGEVFSLLEADYRYPTSQEAILLPNGSKFQLPENLYIIGTMNDIDRSVESMDFALRRRFSWCEVSASESERIIDAKDGEVYRIKKEEDRTRLKKAMRTLNSYIGSWLDDDGTSQPARLLGSVRLNLGNEYQLGGAYFLNFSRYQEDATHAAERLWQNHLLVILNEYLRGNKRKYELLDALYRDYTTAMTESRQA